MKYITILCLLQVFISTVAFAQTGFYRQIPIITPPGADIAFFKPTAVFPCSDNSTIIIGEEEIAYDDGIYWLYDACVIKLDSLGNRMWQTTSIGPNGGYKNVVGIDIDSTNTVYYIVQYDDQFKIYKTDSSGVSTLISMPEFSINSYDRINRAIRLPNGEIVFVGRSYGPNSTFYYTYGRISATGDSLASIQYPPDNNNVIGGAEAFDVELDSDGLPVLSCSINANAVSIVKLDLEGNLIYRIDWTCSPSSLLKYPITKISSLPYLFVGYRDSLGYNVLKNHDNSIELFLSIQGINLYDTLIGSLNSLLVAGLSSDDNEISIYCYNPQANLNWEWETTFFPWSGLHSNSTERLALSSDGCILYAEGEMTMLYVIKLLPNGQVPVEDEANSPSLSNFQVYPNPMSDKVTIEFETNPNYKAMGKFPISLYNIKGQFVRHIQLHKDKQFTYKAIWDGKDINNRDCPSGLYIIKSNVNPNSKKITIFR